MYVYQDGRKYACMNCMQAYTTLEIMDFQQDFGTVDIILNSDLETRAYDAFALSLIKSEKQAIRVFTFLIFQNP